MPRNSNAPSGADVLGLTADDPTLTADLEGVSSVPQGQSKFAEFVIALDRPPTVLIPTGTVVDLEIKGARPGVTKNGFPKASILYVIDGGQYDGESFYDDLLLIPPAPPKKGTMWRFYDFQDAVDFKFPEGTTMTSENVMELLKEMCEAVLGETLKAEMKVSESNPTVKDKDGNPYPPRNSIGKFIKPGARSIDDLLL